VAWFAAREAPAHWLVGATTEPPDLRERLERAGCRPERGAVHMAARLDDLDLSPPAMPAGFMLAAAAEGDLRRHTALLGGETVGEATVLRAAAQLVSGSGLEVGRGARRRGVGRALVLAALTAARGEGASLALLAPTPATVPFYEALGFTLERYPPERRFHLPPAQI
jgi:GNAT superfamily N-acetyltransferase